LIERRIVNGCQYDPWQSLFVEIGIRGSLEKEFARQKQIAERATRSLQERADALVSLSTRVFATGTAAITGFAAAASPAAIDTLTGSVKLLSAQIGQSFIPIVAKASYQIQQARLFVRNLDDATKSNIVQWVLYGTAVAGAVVVTVKIVGVLTKLVGVAQLAASGIALLYANPVLVGLATLAVSLGVIALKLRDTNMEAREMAERAAKRQMEPLGDIGKSAEYKSLEAVSAADRKAELKKRIAQAEEDVKQATSRLASVPIMQQSRIIPALLGFGPTISPKGLTENLERSRDRLARLRKIEAAEAAGIDVSKAGGSGKGFLSGFTGPAPQFLAIEQLSKAITMATLSTSPLETEILTVQKEGNAKLDQLIYNTAELRDLKLGMAK
jgi:hypothetical protein